MAKKRNNKNKKTSNNKKDGLDPNKLDKSIDKSVDKSTQKPLEMSGDKTNTNLSEKGSDSSKKKKKRPSGSGGAAAGTGKPPSPPKGNNAFTKFWYGRSPVLRYILLFGFLMGIFYLVWATQWFHDNVVRAVTTLDAKLASIILNVFGYGTVAEGTSVASPEMTVNVKTGCDGIQAMALFANGVIAYAAPLAHKFKGVIFGLLFLFGVNLFRVVHLWLSGLYMPKYFKFLHENFWQILFIFISIITWAFWINRINKNKKTAAS